MRTGEYTRPILSLIKLVHYVIHSYYILVLIKLSRTILASKIFELPRGTQGKEGPRGREFEGPKPQTRVKSHR